MDLGNVERLRLQWKEVEEREIFEKSFGVCLGVIHGRESREKLSGVAWDADETVVVENTEG